MNIKETHDVTGGLARLALGIDFADLPADVVTRTRHCLLDWLSVLIAGWQNDAVQILLDEVWTEEGPEHATLLAWIIHLMFWSRGFCARKRFHICRGKRVCCAGFPAFEFAGFSFGATGRCAA